VPKSCNQKVHDMISDYLEFDPAIIEKRQVYRLLTGAVVPRPIGWASTVDKNAITNLAPFCKHFRDKEITTGREIARNCELVWSPGSESTGKTLAAQFFSINLVFKKD
jgi:hypothetical protein